jgi:hypothetical protein
MRIITIALACAAACTSSASHDHSGSGGKGDDPNGGGGSGTCNTTTLVTSSVTLHTFDQDADYVYWIAAPDSILGELKTGGGQVAVATSQQGASQLVVSGGYAYFTRKGQIVRAPTDGSDAPTVIANIDSYAKFAVNSTDLYYEVFVTDDIKDTYRAPLDGSTAPVLFVETPGSRSETYMVFVDDSSLYWVHADNYPSGTALHARDLATGADRVVTSLPDMGDLPFLYGDYAATDTTIYWGADEKLLAVDKTAGGAPTTVYAGDPMTTGVTTVTTNGSSLVWAAIKKTQVWSCDDAGCAWEEQDVRDGLYAMPLGGDASHVLDASCMGVFGRPGAGDTAMIVDATRAFWASGGNTLSAAPLE